MTQGNGAKKDFSVSIIGGGIGGLTLAIGLHNRNIDVTVFESAHKFAEIGAGIAIGPNAQNALKQLGLYESFLEFADFPDRNLFFQWRTGEAEPKISNGNGSHSNEDEEGDQPFLSETVCKQYGMASIHRAELLDTFIKKVPQEICRFGKRLKSIKQPTHDAAQANGNTSQVELLFEDGSTHFTDLVIGCDGIHSSVRGALDPSKSGPSAVAGSDKLKWSGTWAYRGLVPREKFVKAVGPHRGEFYAQNAQMFLVRDSHILIFPIQGGKTVNIVAFTTDRSKWPERPDFPKGEAWTQSTSHEAMMADFAQYAPELRRMVECIEKPSKWALHQIMPPLTSYTNGSVVLTGDAAHGGVPHQGAMAGQAIEDALFASVLLSHPKVNKANLSTAIKSFDAIRLPRANKVMQTSLEAGDVYEFAGPMQDNLKKLGEHLVTRFDFIWDYDFAAEQAELESWVQKHLA